MPLQNTTPKPHMLIKEMSKCFPTKMNTIDLTSGSLRGVGLMRPGYAKEDIYFLRIKLLKDVYWIEYKRGGLK